ncbi:MAG TPA: SAM-dependent methyltransferase [Candidatus Blautia faecavium]|uniref:site-specific DNA-methyltransferase (adenine-specific) n=1 Tax=Candidatus Blautia faecavium TaxID=2838487 RepID=A0A9D2LRI6_9FIRM|nr:SAM-dependent methyltransferase [Candidatus Blautia faecavium]
MGEKIISEGIDAWRISGGRNFPVLLFYRYLCETKEAGDTTVGDILFPAGARFKDAADKASQGTLSWKWLTDMLYKGREKLENYRGDTILEDLFLLERMDDALLAQLVGMTARLEIQERDDYRKIFTACAAEESRKTGDFYTPLCLSELMAGLVASHYKVVDNLYDPACGAGFLLSGVSRVCKVKNIYGCDVNDQALRLAKILAVIDGVDVSSLHFTCGDMLAHKGKEIYQVQVANPPFSMNLKGKYTMPIQCGAFADWAIIQNIISHMGERAFVILPLGVLYRNGKDKNVRKWFLEEKFLETLILLPRRLFPGTPIPVCCMALTKDNIRDHFFLIDATDMYTKKRGGAYISQDQVMDILGMYQKRKNIEGVAAKVRWDEIQDGNLYIRLAGTKENKEQTDWNGYEKEIREKITTVSRLEELIGRLCRWK